MSTPDFAAMNRRSLLLAGGAALVLASCASGGNKVQIYVLRADLPKNPPNPTVKWELSVAMPYAAASLNIDRIALTRSSETLDYYADSTWTDRLPVLVQTCLVEAFESSGRIGGVSRDTGGAHADYILETEIRDFAAHYVTTDSQPGVATVHLNAKLLALPDRNIIGTFDSKQAVTASANSVQATVTAFNAALTASLKEIVAWTLTTPPAPTAAPKPAKPARRRRRRRRPEGESAPPPEE